MLVNPSPSHIKVKFIRCGGTCCNFCTPQVESGILEAQDVFYLHRQFEAVLGYM